MSFITTLNELRVFDVSCTSISILPRSFSLLTNLQALYLDACDESIDISVVGKLKKLEILSMSFLKELPREIGHLTNLRILDIIRYSTESNTVTIPCEVISKLHKLEELYMGYCKFESLGCEAEGQGEETNIGFGEIAGLSNLKRLLVGIPDYKCIPNDVEAKPDWDYFSTDIGYLYGLGDRDSRSLSLHRATISMLPDWFINAVANKIEELKYEDFGGSFVTENPLLWRLHELKHLKVFGGELVNTTERVQELVSPTDRVQKGPLFEKLETLCLYYLYLLEDLCVGDLPPGSLVNLKVLRINNCAVKNVSKFVQRFPSLERIDLVKVEKLAYVIGCEGPELKESKQKEVRLYGPAPQVMFHSIKILNIAGYGLLQSLFASDVAQCLSQLESIVVEKEKTALPKLKILELKNLPKLYGANSSTVDIKCHSLEHVVVVNCPHLPFSISKDDFFSSLASGNWISASAADYFGSTNPVQLNDSSSTI